MCEGAMPAWRPDGAKSTVDVNRVRAAEAWPCGRSAPSGSGAPKQRRPGWLARGVAAVVLLCACGSSDGHAGLAPASEDLPAADLTHYDSSKADARDVFSSGTCVEGATKPCRIYLTPHEGIQPCFVGQQTCVHAAWSHCDDAVLVDANQNDSAIGSGGSGTTHQP
jgi:hypothetical protein